MGIMLKSTGLQGLLIKRAICTTSKLRGYIVLVPEIGEDNDSANAVINSDGLPKFNNLTVENCLASIGKQAGIVEKTVRDIEETIKSANEEDRKIDVISDIFNPLEPVTSELETTWGIAKTLYLGNSSLMPTKYYLNIHDRAKRARASKFHSSLIYDCISKSIAPSTPASSSSSTIEFQPSEKRLVNKYLLEGKLNGLSLSDENRKQLTSVLSDLSKERAMFKNKVDTSIRQFSHTLQNYSLVRNFPPELLMSVAVDSNHPTKGPWKITLQSNIIDEFLKYCPDRDERWNIWQASVRKASNLLDKSLDNSTHIELIRSHRSRQAKLLGYKNYAEMSMETKMIKTVDNCKQLFNTLLKHAKVSQQEELETLQEFAINNGFNNILNLYDIPYWKRKHLKVEYDIDEEQLREYFPLKYVIKEIIKLCEELFEIKFVERKKDTDVWHQSVKYYDLIDVRDNTDKHIGGLYLDFYSRDSSTSSPSSSSGWMVGIRNRSQNIKPLSSLIFDFHQPIYGKSYLLTANDLKVILKNFGIALQHLLTQSTYSDIAGLSNMEWDTTEICGYVMMNLLEDDKILKSLSSHYSTEEQLNEKHGNFIKISNRHMSGHQLCQKLYLSDLDLELYLSNEFWLDIVKRLWPIYMPSSIQLDKKNYHLCSFNDIFCGDWSAAYFSHLHSKMIADDISNSIDDQSKYNENASMQIKKRFRDIFLYNDGSLSTAEIFRRFQGRDPSPLPLLKRSNIFHDNLHSKDI